MGGKLALAFAPAAEGIGQMQAQLAIEPEGAGHRCRRTAPGRLLAGIAGKRCQMAQMGPQHDGQARQHEEGGSECGPRRQAGKDDQPQQRQQAGQRQHAGSGQQSSQGQTLRHDPFDPVGRSYRRFGDVCVTRLRHPIGRR